MGIQTSLSNELLEYLVELIDVPPSSYEKAIERYRSVGEWLNRKDGRVAGLSPEVYPQGSFRYGTVVRPLHEKEEYDLDLVCQLALDKRTTTQKQLKGMVGSEIQDYTSAFALKEPAEEKRRCWRLNYADDISFHMDILPCIPDASSLLLLSSASAQNSNGDPIAFTDRTHPRYTTICSDWLVSSPRGFAKWFEGRMKPVAMPRLRQLVEDRVFASIDTVPVFHWKTPLQRTIQILKRHRDSMFLSNPDMKPISMILTTLATQAYRGEPNLLQAFIGIIERMPEFIRSNKPRIPNPVNEKEDFADKWAGNLRLEANFDLWYQTLRSDAEKLTKLLYASDACRLVSRAFGVKLSAEIEERLARLYKGVPSVVVSRAPVTQIVDPPRPWRRW